MSVTSIPIFRAAIDVTLAPCLCQRRPISRLFYRVMTCMLTRGDSFGWLRAGVDIVIEVLDFRIIRIQKRVGWYLGGFM